jgi:hypothetical protein
MLFKTAYHEKKLQGYIFIGTLRKSFYKVTHCQEKSLFRKLLNRSGANYCIYFTVRIYETYLLLFLRTVNVKDWAYMYYVDDYSKCFLRTDKNALNS